MENNEINKILNFVAHCNEFINGKFLFANLKIKEIEQSIEDSEQISLLIKQCETDFKYSLEQTKAFIKMPTKPGYFVKPEEPDKFIALCHLLIKDIALGVKDFDSFATKYFEDEQLSIQEKFCKQIIEPFKNLIADYFELSKDNETFFKLEKSKKEPKSENTKIEQDDKKQIYLEIIEVCKNLIEQITTNDFEKNLKNSALIILLEVIRACERQDEQNVYALLIGLSYLEDKFKPLNHLFDELALVFEKL